MTLPASTHPALPTDPIETDALVVGAGPVGLFQVFQLGLQGIHTQVVDALPHIGGQCIELYADKPIYDIPALTVCTGRELIAQLQTQIQPFGAHFHLGQEVTRVARQVDGRLRVDTSKGQCFLAKTVVIAGGVGAFQPRKLRLPGLDAFEGTQLVYQASGPDAFAGRHLVINGGGEAAVAWALQCAEPGPHRAASVTLVHRRDHLQAPPDQQARLEALCQAQALTFTVGQITGIETSDGKLTHLKITSGDAETHAQPLDVLLVCQGLSPRLGAIAEWGLALERKQVVVNTATFETQEPGIFAVGDINTYPGKRKLILCGFHEATLAAFGVAGHVFPGEPIHLQYTTTSPRLHQLLGVASPNAD